MEEQSSKTVSNKDLPVFIKKREKKKLSCITNRGLLCCTTKDVLLEARVHVFICVHFYP